MIDLPTLPHLIPVASTTALRLAGLRRDLEASGDWPELEVSAALLLADVCQVLDLSDADRQAVLGAGGVAYVEAVANTPVHLSQ